MAICCICNQDKEENINILGNYVCADCEWKILTEPVHSRGYDDCMRKLRKLELNKLS